MNDKPKQAKIEEVETKTFTQDEVDKMMVHNMEMVRQEAVASMAAKQAEMKGHLMQAGQDTFYNIGTWEVMKKMATDMVQSGALPKGDNAYTIMIKMQAGREMGMKPIESIKAFYIVNGILSIFGDAVIRRLREHGWTMKPYQETATSCTATIKKGEEEFTETFTFEEARKSGWTESFGKLKPGWVEGINRKRKLRYGVMSTLIKTYVPEVLGSAVDIKEVVEDTNTLYAPINPSQNAVDDGTPALQAQKDNIRSLIKYKTLSDEDKATADEWIENLTFQEAASKTSELAINKKK